MVGSCLIRLHLELHSVILRVATSLEMQLIDSRCECLQMQVQNVLRISESEIDRKECGTSACATRTRTRYDMPGVLPAPLRHSPAPESLTSCPGIGVRLSPPR